jgi:MFS family permease
MTPPSLAARASALAPFRVRSFRFQWPADLATSWAFEMEALILGWYVLIVTGSVQLLVVVAALAWLGSLFSPFFGVAGDRIGVRTLLCITRGAYALLAAVLAVLTLTDLLSPWHVLVIAAIAGLMRPSDMAMRNVLVGQTMRPEMLMGALGCAPPDRRGWRAPRRHRRVVSSNGRRRWSP